MKTFRILATAAILSAAGVAPALAAWDRIGSVDVSYRQDRDRAYTNFGGGIERLQFRADDSTVNCRFINATFGNGPSRQIFSGRLPRGQAVNVDLPGQSRVVSRLDFSCHADSPRGATVSILADVGRYRDDWRRSPNWTRMWSRMFNWTDTAGMNDTNGWMRLATESFEGRSDSDSSYNGWHGRNVDRIGLKASVDARCTRVRVTFANGESSDLNVDRLPAGQLRSFDLPGGKRNLTDLALRCHAENAMRVTIDIYGLK